MGKSRQGLVVGNYTHDVLIKDDIILTESPGGAVSFISNIFPNLSIICDYISKVGPDFNYSFPNNPPIVAPTSKTTLFHAHFTSTTTGSDPKSDRTLKRVAACDPIRANELPDGRYCFGMAVGVGGEILPETLMKMIDICDIVFVDLQGLIRKFDENDGTVTLINITDTKFYDLLPKIGVLKASAEEAEFIDVEDVRKKCCVVVTDGEKGCRLYWKDGEVRIAAFKTVQVDPTGAGDSLLGGFVAGFVNGLSVFDAALLGNVFGGLTVEQFGLPKFDSKLLQRIKDEVQRRALQSAKYREGDENGLWFLKPPGHDEFHASLNSARQSAQEFECAPTRPTSNCINHVCIGQKILRDAVYDEPIQSVDGRP